MLPIRPIIDLISHDLTEAARKVMEIVFLPVPQPVHIKKAENPWDGATDGEESRKSFRR